MSYDISCFLTGSAVYINCLYLYWFQIEAVWEARFSEVYSNGVSTEEMEHLHEEFVNTISHGNVVGSNLTLVKFRNFMVRMNICVQLNSEN